MRKIKNLFILPFLGFYLGCGGGSLFAAGRTTEFIILPYTWDAGMDGSATVHGRVQPVNVNVGDLFGEIEYSGVFHIEFASPRFGLFFDLTGIRVESETETTVSQTQLDVDLEMTELVFFYRFGEPKKKADLLIGSRYYDLDSDIEVRAINGLLTSDVSSSRGWSDPIIGGRLQNEFAEHLVGQIRGDIGGFGAGSDMVWNVSAILDFRLVPHLSLIGGYRHMDIDYEDGSGSGRFAFDVSLSGPLFGILFTF